MPSRATSREGSREEDLTVSGLLHNCLSAILDLTQRDSKAAEERVEGLITMNGVLWRSLRVPLTRPISRQMASHPTGEELGLTGWKYYFNSETIVGRRNTVLAVYGTLIGGYLLSKLRKTKKQATPQA